jgi:hypothetical protein
MSGRQERQELNQRMFRAANERMQQIIEGFEGQVPYGTVIPFLCECSDDECRGRININTSDYVGIHIDRDLYIVLHDHPTIDGENVVEQGDGYDIVSKAEA